MTAIVDYSAGNIRSVTNALDRLGADYILTDDPRKIASADKVILPGVGNAASAMKNLRAKELDTVIRKLRTPVLGICVGMQIMCRESEEGEVQCMDIFDCRVTRLKAQPDAKVPHVGWNAICNLEGRLFKGLGDGCFVYFVHSFAADTCCDTIATCMHGDRLFSAALRYENFYGTQFHPEKSGDTGEMILANFLAI